MKFGRIITLVAMVPLGIGFIYIGRAVFVGTATIQKLFTENNQLKQSLAHLTSEDQIGYAKVVRQEIKDGRQWTTLKFVETARDDKLKKIIEKECTIEGDIIHFDALIVKFGPRMVMDKNGRALYLWRRIYGEKDRPEDGFAIEQAGTESARYADLFKLLPVKERELFWENIWQLAADPERLKEYDISAVYGSAIYTRLRPGLVYIFKIHPTGQLFPEVVPEI